MESLELSDGSDNSEKGSTVGLTVSTPTHQILLA